MPNISDQELDKLFQEAGQGFRPDFDPHDWDDLAKRLEKEERKAMAKRAGGYGLAVLMLISSAAWLTESSATTRPQLAQTQPLSAKQAENGNDTQTHTLSTDTTTLSSPADAQSTNRPAPTATTSATQASSSAAATTDANTTHHAAEQNGNHTTPRDVKPSTTAIDAEQTATTHDTQNKAAAAGKRTDASATGKINTTTPGAPDKQPLASAKTSSDKTTAQRETTNTKSSADANNSAAQTAGAIASKNKQATATTKASDAETSAADKQATRKGIATIQQTAAQPSANNAAGNKQQHDGETTASSAVSQAATSSSAKTANGATQQNPTTGSKSKTGTTVATDIQNTGTASGQETVLNGETPGNDATGTGNHPSQVASASGDTKPVLSDQSSNAGAVVVTTQSNDKALTGHVGKQQQGAEAGPGAANNAQQQKSNGPGTAENVDTVASVTNTSTQVYGNNQAGTTQKGVLLAGATLSPNAAGKEQASHKDEQPVAGDAHGITTAAPSAANNTTEKELALKESAQATDAEANGATAKADSVSVPKDTLAVVETKAATDTTNDTTAEEAKKKEKTPAKWFLKLPVSPDFSSIDYGKTGSTGLNIGLMVEFMPMKHWSVSLGAIWSKKLYSWDNPDKTYGGGNYPTVKASYLDGDCRVLDIPLNITYYLRPEARTNFFITAGVSSYIMLKETYKYTVWANQKEYQYDEQYVRKNNNLFSMLNLSIGIQHRLSSRFQVQAEPFLKAPISGVGQGKVNLVSMGAFFTLKFQLHK